AAWFAAEGSRVTVTGPDRRAATAFFDRVEELLPVLDAVRDREGTPLRRIETASGGLVEYLDPVDLEGVLEDTDVLFVEEAAALPVRRLERTLDVDRVAYVTTVHGYEGSGRGFAVRFRNRLEEARHDLLDVSLAEPIRYAGGDPVEAWAARALMLGASPVPGQVIEDARPETVDYRALTGAELRENEQLLREVFGLLVTAHYRTEPDDLARLLDGSNLAVRGLFEAGHVVSVALVGREGGLAPATRAAVARGRRIRGNMLPDVLMSQLRDEAAGRPVGLRVVRIATHDAVRSRGLGSTLLDSIEAEFAPVVDWLGTGFGATPGLVDFWSANGYAPVHLSTGRNDRSGEHSVLMLKPTSPTGLALTVGHGRWFATRIGGQLLDTLEELEPEVLQATLAAVPGAPPPRLTPHQWRVVASAAYGPGLYSVDPRPFRDLVVAALIVDEATIENGELLVRGLLQGQSWERVASELGYVSRGAALRALGEALQPIVDTYGPPAAEAVRRRFGTDDQG
ncbi:MAG: tRNA(Met) cytidine acetyltransferase TmcA, partial [Halodesulfurarchaeum sp.]